MGLKPVNQPRINCRQRWEDCKKIAEDLCKKVPTNPGKRR
ncbi:hypothetical protein X474_02885 [Dethiosulfatarculus sandiegensis]|uniref:Uncharacterized protein n=1 Tax=Dethiosulfatarculus sandiegensis TaxID=1429043 RepID=A0A0D2JC70_9BACT|nr:hypothetical protein X474_02885 [Dethiosulfatarculus sandiegensis]